jgi:hypothetical protein
LLTAFPSLAVLDHRRATPELLRRKNKNGEKRHPKKILRTRFKRPAENTPKILYIPWEKIGGYLLSISDRNPGDPLPERLRKRVR